MELKPTKKEPTETVSFRIESALIEKFMELCEEIGVKKSDAIRQLIENFLQTKGK